MAVAAGALLFASACGGGDGAPGGGQVTLQFTGAVTGYLDTDVEVKCFVPTEEGDSFQVRLDSEDGEPVGTMKLSSFDFAAPEYLGARTYDLGAALAAEHFDGEGLFLLFKEMEDKPFLWGDEQGSSGFVTIDRSQRSGRVSLRGWQNADRLRVDVEGIFRCGEKEDKP